MNKLWALLAALVLLAAPMSWAHAAAEPAPQPLVTPAPYERAASLPLDELARPEPGAPFTVQGDAGIAIGDTWYPILRDFTELKAALGEPLDVVLTDSLIHTDYYDKEFIYDFGSVYTHPVDGVDVWYEIFIDSGDFVTSRGIGIGSTPADMLEAYGEEYYADSATVYVYSLSGTEQDYATPSITMEAINNGVIYIDVYYPVFDE
ncbi:MAG: hypothetical protein ACI4L8_02390 [Candidatus Fimadaptatus sp.]